jgi:tetratricopeptide (TPR) repeat protein
MATRVFIVEDDEIISSLIEQFLTIKGYVVAGTAVSGDEVLEKIPGTPCDLILMDIGLKGDSDGITIARILSTRIRIPIIFVTGNFDDNLLTRAKTPNTFGYIIKPFTINDLVSNIEIALFNFRSRAEPSAAPAPAAAGEVKQEVLAKPAVSQTGRLQTRYHVMKEGLKHLYNNGLHHQSRGSYQNALQYFIEILEHDPDDVTIWVEKGDVLQNLGRSGEALAAIDTALRLDPANEYAVCKKCRVLCSLGRHAEALTELETVLEVHPDNPPTLVEKGMVLHELGRNDEAIRVLDHAIGIDKKSGYALAAKGRIMGKLDKDQEALAAFGKALNIEPKNISLWMDVVRLFEQKRNYHTALNVVQRAIEKNPTNELLSMKRETLLNRTIPVS